MPAVFFTNTSPDSSEVQVLKQKVKKFLPVFVYRADRYVDGTERHPYFFEDEILPVVAQMVAKQADQMLGCPTEETKNWFAQGSPVVSKCLTSAGYPAGFTTTNIPAYVKCNPRFANYHNSKFKYDPYVYTGSPDYDKYLHNQVVVGTGLTTFYKLIENFRNEDFCRTRFDISHSTNKDIVRKTFGTVLNIQVNPELGTFPIDTIYDCPDYPEDEYMLVSSMDADDMCAMVAKLSAQVAAHLYHNDKFQYELWKSNDFRAVFTYSGWDDQKVSYMSQSWTYIDDTTCEILRGHVGNRVEVA